MSADAKFMSLTTNGSSSFADTNQPARETRCKAATELAVYLLRRWTTSRRRCATRARRTTTPATAHVRRRGTTGDRSTEIPVLRPRGRHRMTLPVRVATWAKPPETVELIGPTRTAAPCAGATGASPARRPSRGGPTSRPAVWLSGVPGQVAKRRCSGLMRSRECPADLALRSYDRDGPRSRLPARADPAQHWRMGILHPTPARHRVHTVTG